jgi:hypothetical protein
MRAHLKPYHYMLPPYKGRHPDGHTRRPSRTLPCFGQLLSVCGLCLVAPLFLARAQLVGLEPETFHHSQDLKTVALSDCYVSATNEEEEEGCYM